MPWRYAGLHRQSQSADGGGEEPIQSYSGNPEVLLNRVALRILRASGRGFRPWRADFAPQPRPVSGMVQTQVAAQGWLMSAPEGRRPQIRGWRAGGSLAVASSTPATPLFSPAKIRELNRARSPAGQA